MVFPLGAHASERPWNSHCSVGEEPCKVGLVAGLSARSQSPLLLCPSPAPGCGVPVELVYPSLGRPGPF
eukprot:1252841-Heterocapsa_arctica.AAC.1